MKSLTTLVLCYALFTSQTLMGAEAATNSSGVISVDNEVTKAQTDQGASSALTLSSLSLFASGIIAPMYVTWCSNQPSAWIYAGTAGIYVGSEFVNWGKYKNASDRIMKAFINQDRNSQIESLSSAEKQTREAANAAKRKALFSKLAAAGYGAAAAVALMEQLQFWNANGACAGAGSFSLPFTQNRFNIDPSQFIAHSKAIENSTSDINSLMLYQQFFNLVQDKRSSPGLREYRQAQVVLEKQNWGIKSGLLIALDGLQNIAFTKGIAGFGENQMEKAGIALGLAGSAALVLWQDSVLKILPKWVETVSKSGYTRAAVFGAHSMVAMVASAQISDAQKKLEQRANQYQQLVQQLKQMGEGTATTGQGTEIKLGTSEVNEFKSPETDLAFQDMGETSCFVQNSKNETLADSTCSCKKTNSCKQAEIPKVEFKGFSLPGSMNKTLAGLKQAGNSLYSGKYLEASAGAGSVVNNAAGVGKMEDALLKKINERLAKEGKKTTDFNKAKNNYAKRFNSAVGQSLNSMKPSDALVIRQMSNGTSGTEKLEEGVIAKKDENGKIVITPAKEAVANSGSKSDGSSTQDPFNGLNFEEANGVASTAGQNAAGAAATNDEGYEYGDQDGEQISDKPGVSLFSLISNRYLKTAFPRIFSEQK